MQNPASHPEPAIPSRAWIRQVAAVGALAIAACSPDLATAPTELRAPRPVRDVSATATDQLLYQQLPLIGTSLFTTTAYEIADDFTVPAGAKWNVTRVILIGAPHDENYYVNIYPGVGTAPGTNIVTSSGGGAGWPRTTDPCCGGEVFDVSWPLGFTVEAGTYWLSIRSPFRPQLAAGQGNPMVVGRWFPSSWAAAPLSPPNNGMAFAVYGTIETPASATTDLITTIEGFGLDFGTLNSFRAKLNAARAALESGDTAGACRAFQDLINAVNAQSGKKLTTAQATTVIAEANRIRGLIGC